MSTEPTIMPDPIPGHVNLSEIWRKRSNQHKHIPSGWLRLEGTVGLCDALAEQVAHLGTYPPGDHSIVYKGRPGVDPCSRYRVDTFAHSKLADQYHRYLDAKHCPPMPEPDMPLFPPERDQAPEPEPTILTEEFQEAADIEAKTPIAAGRIDFGAGRLIPMEVAGLQPAKMFLRSLVGVLELAEQVPELRDSIAAKGVEIDRIAADHGRELTKIQAEQGGLKGDIDALRQKIESVTRQLAKTVVNEALALWTVERTREWAYVQTLVPWAMSHGVRLTVNAAIREGQILSARCKARGVRVGEYDDPQGFRVRVYPESELREWLEDFRRRNPDGPKVGQPASFDPPDPCRREKVESMNGPVIRDVARVRPDSHMILIDEPPSIDPGNPPPNCRGMPPGTRLSQTVKIGERLSDRDIENFNRVLSKAQVDPLNPPREMWDDILDRTDVSSSG